MCHSLDPVHVLCAETTTNLSTKNGRENRLAAVKSNRNNSLHKFAGLFGRFILTISVLSMHMVYFYHNNLNIVLLAVKCQLCKTDLCEQQEKSCSSLSNRSLWLCCLLGVPLLPEMFQTDLLLEK